MKTFLHIIRLSVIAVLLFCVGGCRNIERVKDIRVTSVHLDAVSPQGFTALNVFFSVGVDNPAFQIGLEDIEGSLKHSGKVLGRLAMDPFVLQARSAEIYHLRAEVKKGESASWSDVLKLADTNVLNECQVDISLKARFKNGVTAPIRINDIPLKKLLEKASNEKN